LQMSAIVSICRSGMPGSVGVEGRGRSRRKETW
jgi:hypothetical protein